jgi:hypothetical protein
MGNWDLPISQGMTDIKMGMRNLDTILLTIVVGHFRV